MKTSKEIPKIYNILKAQFGIDWDKGICITYGDTCYSKNEIRADLMAHEEVHEEQQKLMGPEVWWKTYLEDKTFRLNQEVEAYQVQLKFLLDGSRILNRAGRRLWIKNGYPKYLSALAKDLSSSVYGNMVNYTKALELLS